MLMFKRMRRLFGGCALACVLGGAAGAAAQTPRPLAEQLAPDIYMVQGVAALGSSTNRNFISNAGFVVTPDGVLVVDALGAPVLAREMLAEIRRITPSPVRYVVVSHYHADHVCGLQELKAAGAVIVAHRAGREYLNSQTAVLRLAVSRDQLAPQQWIAALDKLLALEPALIVPGHGPPSASARADLELTRDYLVYLRRTMGEAARNMDSFEDAYARTDWSRYAKLPPFSAANRINAYNTYLPMERAGP